LIIRDPTDVSTGIAILIIGFGSVALFAAFEAVFGSSLGKKCFG